MAAQSNLSHIARIHYQLSRLRGIDSDILKAAGFDDQLQALEATTETIQALREVVTDLSGLDDAMQLLILLLQRAEDEPLSALGLKNLLEPLRGGLRLQTERLSGLI